MIRRILKLFGLHIVYACDWGEYAYRYDGADQMAMRPIHPDMSVAPPWARLKLRRVKT